MLHLPSFDETKATKIQEREFWPTFLNANLTMIGIPGANLFAGLKEDEIKGLYFDPKHFNKNRPGVFHTFNNPNFIFFI